MNSGPFLLIIGPLLGGLTAVLLQRWARLTAVSGAVASGALWLALRLSSGSQWPLFGVSFVLTDEGRALFQGLLLLLGLLFVLALRWPPGRHALPACLAAVSPLAAMVMVRPLTLGALFLVLAAVLLAVGAANGAAVAAANGAAGVRSAMAAWRYLMMALLALPMLLLVGWLADAPGALPLGAARVLAVASIILVGGFPFMLWVRPTARQAGPLLRPFLFGGAPLVVMAFLFSWLQVRPDWQADPGFQTWLRWSGLMTAVLGGLLAATAADWDDLLVSLLLLDVGAGLLVLLLPGALGWQTAVSIHVGRAAGLLLAGVGRLGVWRRPLAVGLMAYGCLTLLGLPLTLGFNGRWALLAGLPGQNGGGVAVGLLLLAQAAGLWGVAHWAWRIGRSADSSAP